MPAESVADSDSETGETGEPAEPDLCMSAQPIDAGICRVLPTGLVLGVQADELVASILRDDGTFEKLAPLPAGIDCDTSLAHDPVNNKLWWLEYGQPWMDLHQVDLEFMNQEWHRELAYLGYNRSLNTRLLAHDGSVFVGGFLEGVDVGIGYEYYRSLLERIDLDGVTRWSQIGSPGFGFTEEYDGQPLHGIGEMFAVTGGIGFQGWTAGVDSAALTLATADLETGEVIWSRSLVRDSWATLVAVDGRGDHLVSLVATGGEVIEGGLVDAQTSVVASGPLGEQGWQLDDVTWLGPLWPEFVQVVLDERVVHFTHEVETRVIERDHTGTVVCDAEFPELTGLSSVVGVRGEMIVVMGGSGAWLLSR